MELRPYQHDAVGIILDKPQMLLAMTMGSGKTATAITSVRRLRRARLVDHGVVFALKSIKYQWVREIQKWDPRASVQVVDGSKPQRSYAIRHADEYHYTILHYHCLVNDWDLIKQFLPIDFVILDEATAIKNPGAKTSKRAKVLGKHTDVRLALSGQPLENRPEELFSIMQFVDPEVLGPFPKFDRAFITRDHWGNPRSYKNLPILHKRMETAMFRRSREDIKEWLPERIALEVPIILEPAVMKLHDHIRADLSAAIDDALSMGVRSSYDVMTQYTGEEKMGAMGQVMSRMLAMRMLSAHPHLLRLSASDFDSPLSQRGSEYASLLGSLGLLDGFPVATTKLTALVEMVGEILDEDPTHKVVIFSYFKPMLAMIKAALWKAHSARSVLITGDVTGLQRDRAIVAFNTDSTVKIFLSSDAGAYGVDLNQGSHVINYDLPWSGGALAQRVARIDRTNSAFKTIYVMDLFGQGTIEERMHRMLLQKAKVARAFLDGEYDAKSGGLRLDLESLREFLDAP